MASIKATVVFQDNWEAVHATNDDGSRKYKYIINQGGSRSSKTFSLIDLCDLYARSNDRKRITIWRSTKTDTKNTVLKDAIKLFKDTGRYGVGHVFNKTESYFTYATDSVVEIQGTDEANKVHGLTQDVAWLNEPYDISREVFDQIDQRTSDFVIIDMNPKQAHWIDDIKKDSRAIVIHSDFRKNPFCPPEQRKKILSYQSVKFTDVVVSNLIKEQDAKEYNFELNPLRFTEKQIKELKRCIENEEKRSANDYNWQVYGLGLKAERPNRILRFFEMPLSEYLKIDLPTYYGIDWGVVDPWGIVEAKYDDGNLYLREKNYKSENQIKDDLTSVEHAQIDKEPDGFVKWYFKRLGIPQNAELVCDNNKLDKIAALRQIGYDYATPAIKPPGSVAYGIGNLTSPKLKVWFTSDSPNLKYEQENYSRKVDRYGNVLEEPEDKFNHLIDPVRYIISYLIRIGVLTPIQ